MTASSLEEVEYVYRAGVLTEGGERCWRVVAVAIPVGSSHSYYDDVDRLVNTARTFYGQAAPPILRCEGDPFRGGPTPEQQAMMAWEQVASGLAPTVVSQPADRSVVGLPTFLIVDAYQPAGDIDAEPDTVTWDFGAFQLRATSSHLVQWADGDGDNEFAYEPTWRATNGREFIAGDEHGPTAWSGGHPTYQGAVEPLAHIYQAAGTRSVTLHARWQAEWRLPGGSWAPLAVNDLFTQAALTIEVAEYQPVIRD